MLAMKFIYVVLGARAVYHEGDGVGNMIYKDFSAALFLEVTAVFPYPINMKEIVVCNLFSI